MARVALAGRLAGDLAGPPPIARGRRRRSRLAVLEAGALAAVLGLGLAPAAPAQVQARAHPVVARDGHRFDGWGVNLAWEPVLIDQLPLAPAQKREVVEKLLDVLFTTGPVDIGKGRPVEGLGLNVVRYIVQGGQNPAILAQLRDRAARQGTEYCDSCWGAGWEAAPGQWNDSAEAAQRYWLKGAIERIKAAGRRPFLMAAANAPPYWMTLDGSAAGAPEALEPNLDADGIQAFAAYEIAVLERLRRHVTPDADWGVEFDLFSPLNEPNNNTWTRYNRQEGIYFPHSQQAELLRTMALRLRASGMKTLVAANDDSRIGDLRPSYNYDHSALGTLEDFARDPSRADVLGLIGEVSVHTYIGDRRKDLAALAGRLGKTVVVSEAGCCDGSDALSYQDSFRSAGAFWMAEHVRRDVLDLGARAWVLWQPDWGILQVEKSGAFDDYPQFWLLRFIMYSLPPGSLVLASGNDHAIVSVEDRGNGKGVLRVLAINTRMGPATSPAVSLDLSAFEPLVPQPGYRASAPAGNAAGIHFEGVDTARLISPQGSLELPMPEQSVTAVAFEIDCGTDCARPR